jgi:hypothetical protein
MHNADLAFSYTSPYDKKRLTATNASCVRHTKTLILHKKVSGEPRQTTTFSHVSVWGKLQKQKTLLNTLPPTI